MKYERGSFIVVPSKEILDGLPAQVQVLYMWLCAYANETGNCFPSRATLARNCGCSVRTIDESMEKLIYCELVKKERRTFEGENLTNVYTVILRGGSAKSAPPSAKSARGVVQNLRTELNPVLTKYSPEAFASEGIRIEKDVIDRPKKESTAKYPHAKEVFSWFPHQQKSWLAMKNVQEREHAEYLYERGKENVIKALKYCEKHKDEEFFPRVTKPSDLEKKWEDIKRYAARNR